MARPKSALLSSFGKLFELFRGVINAVLSLDGTDEDVLVGLSDPRLIEKLAKIIYFHSHPLPQCLSFRVRVTSLSLNTMLTLAGFREGSLGNLSDQTAGTPACIGGFKPGFSFRQPPGEEFMVELLHFDQALTTDQIFEAIDRAGYRPCGVFETLALSIVQPDLQKQMPLVALGDVANAADPYGGEWSKMVWVMLLSHRMGGAEPGRTAEMFWFQNDQYSFYWYPCVKKVA